MTTTQEQIALTSMVGAVLATALVALLGWGPKIAVEHAVPPDADPTPERAISRASEVGTVST